MLLNFKILALCLKVKLLFVLAGGAEKGGMLILTRRKGLGLCCFQLGKRKFIDWGGQDHMEGKPRIILYQIFLQKAFLQQ